MVVKVKMDGLYVVSWLDAAGYMMEDLKAAKPCECVTVGWVKKVKKDHIVLASSYYPDDKQGFGDYCVLPKGMITKTELLSPLPHSSAASSPPSLAVQQEH